MTTLKQAVRKSQIDCLLRAQDSLAKARLGEFSLPDDVALAVQDLLDKIPKIIHRLEGHAAPAGTALIGHSQEMHDGKLGKDRINRRLP